MMLGAPEVLVLFGLAFAARSFFNRGDRKGRIIGTCVAVLIVSLLLTPAIAGVVGHVGDKGYAMAVVPVVFVAVLFFLFLIALATILLHRDRLAALRKVAMASLVVYGVIGLLGITAVVVRNLMRGEAIPGQVVAEVGLPPRLGTPPVVLDRDDASSLAVAGEIQLEESDKSADLPDWVTEEVTRLPGKYSKVLVVGPYTTIEECRSALEGELAKEFKHFTAAILGDDAAERVDVSPNELQQCVSKQWTQTLELSVGPMQQHYALVEFDDAFRKSIERRWRETVSRERFEYTGLGAGAVLLAVGACFGYLKLDDLTGGAYRRRLLAAVLSSMLAIVAAVGVIWKTAI